MKRHKVSSTEIRFDNIHYNSEQEVHQKGFRSTRNNRIQFKEQDKRLFQDEEDITDELEHLRVVSDFKDLSDALEIVLCGMDGGINDANDNDETNDTNTNTKKKRRVKVKLNYGEDLEDTPDFNTKLKRVETKMKLQKIVKKLDTDSLYTSFVKDHDTLLPRINPIIPSIPNDYTPNFKRKDIKNAPLTKYTASSLLKSKFTSANTAITPTSNTTRITIPITIDPLVKKRLNIT